MNHMGWSSWYMPICWFLLCPIKVFDWNFFTFNSDWKIGKIGKHWHIHCILLSIMDSNQTIWINFNQMIILFIPIDNRSRSRLFSLICGAAKGCQIINYIGLAFRYVRYRPFVFFLNFYPNCPIIFIRSNSNWIYIVSFVWTKICGNHFTCIQMPKSKSLGHMWQFNEMWVNE